MIRHAYQNASRTGGAGHDALRLPGRGEYPVTHRSHVYRHAVHTAPGTSRASRLGREMLRVYKGAHMSISAIQTTYKGYRFRSRLEARWAVFFDALEIKWQYEPQGYEKEMYYDKKIMYLPDFYLPDSKLYIEVKGNSDFEEWANLAEAFLDYHCPMPYFTNSYEIGEGGFMILGNIPNPDTVNYFGIIRHSKGLWKNFIRFCNGSVANYPFINNDAKTSSMLGFAIRDYVPENLIGWDYCTTAFNENSLEACFSNDCLEVVAYPRGSERCPATKDAYLKARGARFEYGESG